MTDDELRDDFGESLASALAARTEDYPETEAASGDVRRRVRRVRVRRRAFGAGALAAVVALVSVAVATRGTNEPSRVRVANPTATTVPVIPGERLVSYHGVQVQVPQGWPVVDGMHTVQCGSPFPETPTAFVGPQENFPLSCPAPFVDRMPHLDGVWLAPGAADDYPGARAITTPSGLTASEYYQYGGRIRIVSLRGVTVEIGVGTDPSTATAIFDSIAYDAGAGDTAGSGACARIADPDVMPTPERLTSRLVLDNGTVVLDPPGPNDQAATDPAAVWGNGGRRNFEHYRLVLARYSSLFPAKLNGNGSETPENWNELAWVVLSAPNTPTAGCGLYGIDATDALTGGGIGSIGYGPGP